VARDLSAVVVVARSSETLQETASKVQAEREPASAELVVKQTLDRYGRIDALINVASHD
jgi:3-oxoacyl-[acyl-carrier protein] reductase